MIVVWLDLVISIDETKATTFCMQGEEHSTRIPMGLAGCVLSARTTRASSSGSHLGHDAAEATALKVERHMASCNRGCEGRMTVVLLSELGTKEEITGQLICSNSKRQDESFNGEIPGKTCLIQWTRISSFFFFLVCSSIRLLLVYNQVDSTVGGNGRLKNRCQRSAHGSLKWLGRW